MDIFRAQTPGVVFGSAGNAYWRRRELGSLPQQMEFSIPSGYNFTNTLGNWVQYKNRLYGANVGTQNAMIDEYLRFSRLGIAPPVLIPTLAAGGAGGGTGNAVVAISFYDALLDEHSPLSGSSNLVAIANQKRTTANIQTTSDDSRVTHVAVWVSMDGGSFRLSTMRQLGVSTVSEGVATLALGAAFPTTFTRFGRMSCFAVYHERLITAGDALNPDTVYVSAIGKPERYEGLSFRTPLGETVTSLISARDVCLVMTATNAYVLRGYKDADMTLTLLDADVGSVNQSSWKIVHGNPIVVNHNGVWLFNGAFHNIIRERQEAWALFYANNRAQVEASHAAVNPADYTYALYVNAEQGPLTVPAEIPNPSAVTIGTIAWVADYRPVVPELAGSMGQPNWLIDVIGRQVTCNGLLNIPGSKRFDLHLGNDDGIVRYLTPATGDDDGDAYAKRWWVRTGANHIGYPGGDIESGKTFKKLWTYMQAEATAWILYARGGDEEAWAFALPDNITHFFKHSVAASAKVEITEEIDPTPLVILRTTTKTYAPKEVHVHAIEKCSGRALTLDYTCVAPIGIRWRGYGGVSGPGPATRMPNITIVEIGV